MFSLYLYKEYIHSTDYVEYSIYLFYICYTICILCVYIHPHTHSKESKVQKSTSNVLPFVCERRVRNIQVPIHLCKKNHRKKNQKQIGLATQRRWIRLGGKEVLETEQTGWGGVTLLSVCFCKILMFRTMFVFRLMKIKF